MNERKTLAAAVLAVLVLAAACGGPPAPSAPGPLAILVTNDDGIEAAGIAALAEALAPLGTVTVAAPDRGRSGASHGVTSDRPIAVRESARAGQRWIAIDALPATCVRLAVEEPRREPGHGHVLLGHGRRGPRGGLPGASGHRRQPGLV